MNNVEASFGRAEPTPGMANNLLSIELNLSLQLKSLMFCPPVAYVYNPLDYAYDVHSKFVHKYCRSTKKILFLGMNPGPWGMVQTGIPFGEVSIVRDWLGVTGHVGSPERVNPSRPVLGFACCRSEVSGRKFWGLFKDISGEPENFFRHTFIYNHCPCAYMTESGKNVTPAEFKAAERKTLNKICDEALCKVLQLLQVECVIAIGKFAEKRATDALKGAALQDIQVNYIPHPSPRNFAVKDWPGLVTTRLKEFGVLQHLLPHEPITFIP